MFELTGYAAIVTGGARGIGRAIALALADAGADVAILALQAEGPGEVGDHRIAGDVLAEDGRAHRARHHAHLGAADVHAVTVAHRLVRVDLQPHELAARVFLALDQRAEEDQQINQLIEVDSHQMQKELARSAKSQLFLRKSKLK